MLGATGSNVGVAPGPSSDGAPLLPKGGESSGTMARKPAALSRSEIFGFATCAFYAITAVSMGFINKAVLMTAFTQSNVLLLMQQVVTSVLIVSLRSLGLIQCREFDWATARKCFGVVLLYNANVAFALGALRLLNMPMYNVLKRLCPCFILFVKVFSKSGERPSRQVASAVLLTVVSTLIAGAGDLALDVVGYAYGLASCALQTAYLLLVEKTGTEKELTSTELLLYNGVLSAPFLLAVTLATGELAAAGPALSAALAAEGLSFVFVLGITLVGGSLLNYALFLCTMTNSALTTTIVGHAKTIITTALGFFLLGGVQPTPLLLIGIILNTVGGLWYGHAKHQEKLAAQARAAHQRPPAYA